MSAGSVHYAVSRNPLVVVHSMNGFQCCARQVRIIKGTEASCGSTFALASGKLRWESRVRRNRVVRVLASHTQAPCGSRSSSGPNPGGMLCGLHTQSILYGGIIDALKICCRKFTKEKTGKKPFTNINLVKI